MCHSVTLIVNISYKIIMCQHLYTSAASSEVPALLTPLESEILANIVDWPGVRRDTRRRSQSCYQVRQCVGVLSIQSGAGLVHGYTVTHLIRNRNRGSTFITILMNENVI